MIVLLSANVAASGSKRWSLADEAYQLNTRGRFRSTADRQASFKRVKASSAPHAALDRERLRLGGGVVNDKPSSVRHRLGEEIPGAQL